MEKQKRTSNPYFIIFVGCLFLLMAWRTDSSRFIPSEVKWVLGFAAIVLVSICFTKNRKMNKPYYAVIFTTQQTETLDGYEEMAEKMHQLAQQQPGFIDLETARSEIGITVSYWENEEAIIQWKSNTAHLQAQQLGKEQWYTWYKLRICRVEREYDFSK